MPILFWFILVLGSLDVISVTNATTKERGRVADGPSRNYNEVVLNMIRSWESPVVYLRGRGFLPSDYQDTSKIKPSLDALMQRLERDRREAKKDHNERIRPQEIEDVRVAKQKKSLGWEQLQILSSKLAGLKPKQDDREGREGQLMAMMRRFEQKLPGASCTSQQSKIQGNVNLASSVRPKEQSAQSYDEILQRMIEKTSPHSKGQHSGFHFPIASAPAANSNSAKEDNPQASAPISLKIRMPISSRLEDQEGKSKEAASNLKPGLEAPTFLNWDMKNGRLDHYSRSEKEAYLNKLLRAFGQKLDSKETRRRSENTVPKRTQNP